MKEYVKIITPKNNLEIELQKYVSEKYSFCPKIISCIYYDNYIEVTMEKINGLTLFEKYSDQAIDIPEIIWTQIRNIVSKLFYEDGIEYIDISPYNFIIKEEKVYIIDFGHAYWCNKDCKIKNWFLKKFLLENVNEFNSDFY